MKKITALILSVLLILSAFAITSFASSVCSVAGKDYEKLSDALHAANGEVVTLKSNATLDGGNIFPKSFIVDGSGKYKITLNGDATWLNVESGTFKNVTVDLNGKHFQVTQNSGVSKIIFGEGAIVENGFGANGGVAIINSKAEVVLEKGSIIRNCKTTGGGGAFHVNGGILTINGGGIENCSANGGGAVLLATNGRVNLSGNPVITGNKTNEGKENNIDIRYAKGFFLTGEFTGDVGVTIEGNTKGTVLGKIEGTVKGAEKIKSDVDKNLVASVSGNNILLNEKATAVSGGTADPEAKDETVVKSETKVEEKGEACIVGDKKYESVVDAIYASNGATVKLLRNAYLSGGNIFPEKFSLDGNGFALVLEADATWLNVTEGKFTNVTLDLAGKHFQVTQNKGTSKIIFGSGVKIKNGSGANGGVAIINKGAEVIIEKGVTIEKCTATGGGGAFHVNGGTLTMTGGSIKNCSAASGGGVIVTPEGKLKVSGDATITGNTNASGIANNVKIEGDSSLTASGTLSGGIGITFEGAAEGVKFGIAEGSVSGLDKIFLDTNTGLIGSVKDGTLSFAKGQTTADVPKVEVVGPACYVGNNSNNTYQDLDDALKNAKGQTITLLKDCDWKSNASHWNYQNKKAVIIGNGHTIKFMGTPVMMHATRYTFENVTLDLNKNQIRLSSTGEIILKEGTKVINGQGANGGAFLINQNAMVELCEGSLIENCSATNGGGAVYVNGATLKLSGGTIKNCSAIFGAAITVNAEGKLILSGNPKISGNKTAEGVEQAITLMGSESVILKGTLTEKVYFDMQDGNLKEGDYIGYISGSVMGASNISATGDDSLCATVMDNSLVIVKKETAVSEGSAPVIAEDFGAKNEKLPKTGWKIEANSSRGDGGKNIIDGDILTIWHSGYDVEGGKITRKDNPPFNLDITLPSPTVISGVSFTPRQDTSTGGLPTEIKVYAEVNGEYKLLGEYSYAAEGHGIKNEEFMTNISVTKVRIQVANGTGGYGSLAEVDLFGKRDDKESSATVEEFIKYRDEHTLIAVEKEKMSAEYEGEVWSGHTASFLVDGTYGFFQTQPVSSNLYEAEIDMGATYNLSAVSYLPRQQDSDGFWVGYEVLASTDGVNYEKVASRYNRDFDYSKQMVYFDTPVRARYFIFKVTENEGGKISCAELDFYETKEERERRLNEGSESYTLVIGKNEIIHKNGTQTIDVAPYIENGTTLIPLRGLLELMGASIEWNGDNRSITVTKDDMKILLYIDLKNVFVTTAKDGEVMYTLYAAPGILNSRTFVPVRFVSEQLGYNVTWISETQTILITK